MLTLPDFNRLKVFSVVYAHKSIVRASKALYITRSAVSQALKALEGELGTALFIRNSKKMQATEAAELLFAAMSPFLNDLSSAIQQIETGKEDPVGHLRIGAPNDFGSTQLTRVIGEFRKVYPSITFEVVLAIPTRQLSLLSEGKLDLAFVDNADVHATNHPVSSLTVMKENFVLVCSKRYFDKRLGKREFRSAIEELDFIDYVPHAPVIQMWMKKHLGKTQPKIRVVYSAESVRAVLTAIYSDIGLGVVPEHLVIDDIKAGKIRLISQGERVLVNQIALVRTIGKSVSAREKLFVDYYKAKAFS